MCLEERKISIENESDNVHNVHNVYNEASSILHQSSSYGTPTKYSESFINAHTIALTNGIWESEEDTISLGDSSPLTVGSTSSTKKRELISPATADKENVENVNYSDVYRNLILQEGVLERKVLVYSNPNNNKTKSKSNKNGDHW
jgi:hypothetical protein